MKLPETPLLRATMMFAAIAAVLAALAVLLRPLLIPILMSFVLYVLLSPAVSQLERAGVGRSSSILLVLLGMMLLMGIGLVLTVPSLAEQLAAFQERLPAMWQAIAQRLDAVEQWISGLTRGAVDTGAVADSILRPLRDGGVNVVAAATQILANAASLLVVVPILTFFLLRDLRAIRNGLMDLLPNRGFELGWLIYAKVVEKLGSYLRGVLVQSAVMAGIATIGFGAIGLELSVLLGLLAGVLNIIPYVGPLLALVAPALLVLAANPPDMGLLLVQSVGVVIFAQLIDNVVVVPTLIAQAADLHPLTVLTGIVVIGYLFGFLGMILAIPVLFSAKIIFLGLLNGLSGDARRTAPDQC